MDRTNFLGHYRVNFRSDGAPREISSTTGAVPAYEAVDERTGELVCVRLVSAESIDPAAREQFGEQASTAQNLRHVNIAEVVDFGREGDDYVYVSEHLLGEALLTWVLNHD